MVYARKRSLLMTGHGEPGLANPGAEDLGNMFQFNRDFEQDFCGARDIDGARALNPSLQTFDEWLSKNKDRVPLE